MANEHRITVDNLAVFKEEADKEYISGKSTQSLTPTQQVNAQNNMMGKAYAPAQNSGLGKVYLAKNDGVLTQAMMQATNTVYVIQYDYIMGGNITVPAGCTLEFDGGSINSGGNDKNTITGDSTIIIDTMAEIFDTELVFIGTWNLDCIRPEWFGAKKSDGIDDTLPIRRAVSFGHNIGGNVVKFSSGTYTVGTFELFDGDYGYSAIEIYSNMRYIGENAVIKVQDGVNKNGFAWQSVFSSIYHTNVKDVVFDGIYFNLNGANNLYPSDLSNLMSCAAIKMFYPEGRIVIKNCIFESSPGAHYICPGHVKDCLIANCTFRNCADTISGNTYITDHSSILIAGTNVSIVSNILINNNRSTKASAIEVESNNATISNNVISGYSVGYLIASVGVSKTDSTIFNGNKIYNTGKPIELWNGVATSGNIVISNNIIEQSVTRNYGQIINLSTNVHADVNNILITGNLIYSTESLPQNGTGMFMTNSYIHGLVFKNNVVRRVTGGIQLLDGSDDVVIEDNIFDNILRNSADGKKAFIVIQPNTAVSDKIVIRRNRINCYVEENPIGERIGIWVLGKQQSLIIDDNEISNAQFPIRTSEADFSVGTDRSIKIINNYTNFRSAAPTTGSWRVGDAVYNSSPTAGGVFAWVCVEAGTPGIWKPILISA